jgi:hypothetical protein
MLGQPQVAGAGVSHIVWQKALGFLNRFCVVKVCDKGSKGAHYITSTVFLL